MEDLFELKIPIFWNEGKPEIDFKNYKLSIVGLVKRALDFSLLQLEKRAKDSVSARLTSVTRWSVRLNWEGILCKSLLNEVKPLKNARFVKFVSYGRKYFTVVPIEAMYHERAIIALAANNAKLPVEYGGPVRVVFPQLWGYKSAKSIVEISFQERYEKGYWESRGYDDSAEILPTKVYDINAGKTKFNEGGEVLW